MTTYNTQNPLGSSDPRDLYDNAEDLDNFVNGDQPAYDDRLGKSRKSWQGMEDEFAAFIAAGGYVGTGTDGAVEDYAAGIEITGYNQIVRDTSGEFWRLSGSVTLPYTTTGAGLPEGGNFVSVGDAALRQELGGALSSGLGASIVNGATIYVGSVAELEGLSLDAGVNVYLTEDGRAGAGVIKSGSHASDPQMGVFIDLANGNYWERQYSGAVSVKWFGAKGDGVTDDTESLQAALDGGGYVFVPDGIYMTKGVNVFSDTYLVFSSSAIFRLIPENRTTYALLKLDRVVNVTIRDAHLEGDRYNNTSTTGEQGHGIRVQGSEHVRIIGGYATACWGDGIVLATWTPDGRVNGKNLTVRDFDSYDNRRQGLSIGGGDNILIENCIFRDTNGTAPEHGIDVETDPVSGVRASNLTFRNCIMAGNNGCGLALLDLTDIPAPVTVDGVKVIDCRLIGNALDGLRVYKARNILVQGTELKDNQDNGAYLLGTAEVSFLNCTLSGNTSDGADLRTGASGSMSECSIVENLEHGVIINASDIAITNSEVAENVGVGIYVGSIIAGSRTVVRGCEIRDNGGRGIYVTGSAALETPYQITDNFVYGNVVGGLAGASNIESQVSNGFILRNIVRKGSGANTADRGLRLLNVSNVSVIDNDLRGGGSVTDYLVQTSTVISRDNFPYKSTGSFSERPTTNLQLGMTYYDIPNKLLLYHIGGGQWKDGAGNIYT